MKIVIGGSGFGGVKLALELANQSAFEVVLVSDRPSFEYHAALYRSATGRSPLEVVLPLRDIFEHTPNVRLELDRLSKVDPKRHVVTSETGNEYAYDALVLALGQVNNYMNIDGMAKYSYSLDTITNTIKLRRALHDIMTSRAIENRDFVVVGGGPSGVELAAELKMYLEHLCDKHSVEPKSVGVTLIEGAPRLLPTLSEKMSRHARKRLEKLGVNVRLNASVKGRSPEALDLGNDSIKAETVIWTAGWQNNPFFASNQEVFNLTERGGRVVVDETLRATDNIFVIGDSAATPYSGMAQTALYDAEFVAANLMRLERGQVLERYKPHRPIYVVPVGGKYAVLQWGSIVLHGYSAWLLRRLADFRLFADFEPLKDAVKTWRHGNRRAREQCPVCLLES